MRLRDAATLGFLLAGVLFAIGFLIAMRKIDGNYAAVNSAAFTLGALASAAASRIYAIRP